MKTSTSMLIVRPLALVFVFFAATAGRVDAALFDALYAFGDSLSDLGNTYNTFGGSAADHTTYTLFGYTASPGRYDDGRWSNGPLWIEHLNDQLGLPPLQRNQGSQPLSMGTNFAFGGTTTSTGDSYGLLPNLQNQIFSYLNAASHVGSPDSLYSVWAGGNDVIYYISDGNPNTPAAIDAQTTTMSQNIIDAVTSLYNVGARHFLVPNLPALGDKPSYVDTPNQAFANAIVDSYNPKLKQALEDFAAAHSDAVIVDWDVYAQFADILANWQQFGFTNTTAAAFSDSGPYPGTVVADPDSHVFWDGTHPTAKGHALLGAFAYDAVLGVKIPEPSAALLLTMALVAARTSRKRRNGAG